MNQTTRNSSLSATSMVFFLSSTIFNLLLPTFLKFLEDVESNSALRQPILNMFCSQQITLIPVVRRLENAVNKC